MKSGQVTLPGIGGETLARNERQRAVDAFDAAYREAYGRSPSWGAKQVRMVKDLVSRHGADEVITRIERLFTVGLGRVEPPYDVGTLVAFFDRLVIASPSRKLSPSDIASGAWRKR